MKEKGEPKEVWSRDKIHTRSRSGDVDDASGHQKLTLLRLKEVGHTHAKLKVSGSLDIEDEGKIVSNVRGRNRGNNGFECWYAPGY